MRAAILRCGLHIQVGCDGPTAATRKVRPGLGSLIRVHCEACSRAAHGGILAAKERVRELRPLVA
jgi:hypothetical protein